MALAPSKHSASMIGKRVEEYIKAYREADEPIQLAPHCVGVHPLNRGGSNPNVQTLQNKILGSFYKDGYDSSRHLVPIVVRCTSEQKRRALIEHNVRFAEGGPDSLQWRRSPWNSGPSPARTSPLP